MLLILLSLMLMSPIVGKSAAPSDSTTMRKDFGTNLSATDSLAVKANVAPIAWTCNPRALLRFASENTAVLYKIDAQPAASSMKLKSGKLLRAIQTSKISTLTADLAATPAVVFLLRTSKVNDKIGVDNVQMENEIKELEKQVVGLRNVVSGFKKSGFDQHEKIKNLVFELDYYKMVLRELQWTNEARKALDEEKKSTLRRSILDFHKALLFVGSIATSTSASSSSFDESSGESDQPKSKEFVVALDHNNFTDFVGKHKFIIVEFYTPCGISFQP